MELERVIFCSHALCLLFRLPLKREREPSEAEKMSKQKTLFSFFKKVPSSENNEIKKIETNSPKASVVRPQKVVSEKKNDIVSGK